MNVDEVVAVYRAETRRVAWPGETLDALPGVTRRSWVSGEANEVSAFGLDRTNVDEAIRQEVAHFRDLGRSFEWKAYSFDEPPDSIDRLRAAGFTIGEREALVFYDLAGGMEPFEGDPACEVRRIERVEDLADFRRVAEEVFGKDYSPTTGQLAEALRTGQQGHDGYVATVDGEPASVGRLYTNPESAFGGLYGGGTLPRFRGRGLYRAVVAARARDAAAKGVRYLQVDALPTSLPILKRMGFVHVADTWPCASPSS